MPLKRTTSHRARRWDVLVLGGALPGLVAAIRLAMAQHRVLVVEEEAAARTPDLLREPFSLTDASRGGVLDRCLQALGLPINERRALSKSRLAYQVLLPDARVDVDGATHTAEELVAWGLAKPDFARDLLRDLEKAARAECEAMLEAEIVRRSGLRALARPGRAAAPRHDRGLPSDLPRDEGTLARFFAAQEQVLCGVRGGTASPEARARILGAALCGESVQDGLEGGLRALIKRRLRTLHAEFRTLGCPFEFVEVGSHPGIERSGPGDAWLGRAVVVNAPTDRLALAFESWGIDAPEFLAQPGDPGGGRRVSLHLRAAREVVPEGLAARAICVTDDAKPLDERNLFSLALHPSPRGDRFVELVASATVPEPACDLQPFAEHLEQAVRTLMPFSDKRLAAAPLPPLAHWDDEAALPRCGGADGWPGVAEIRAAGRHPIFTLPRDALAGLGVEGDLLLGWRAGDAIRAELA